MRVRAIDLFCGAGGLTHGLLQAGIEVVSGFDINEACRYPFERNNGVRFVRCDLSRPDLDTMVANLGGGGPTLVAGCAPCQRFSTYDRHRRGSGESWPLLDTFGGVVARIVPDYVTMENVPGLQSDPAFARFHRLLTSLGYKVVYDILDCNRYGVPQSRRRLVLLASRAGHIDLPDPTHPTAVSRPTVRSAIGDLPELCIGEADASDRLHAAARMSELNLRRLRASRPGGTWEDWPEELRAACHRKPSGAKYKNVYGRMEWDKPAPTITGQANGFGNGRFGHPDQDRTISLREAALLQTFPRAYEFLAPTDPIKLGEIGVLIGNAVPPRLGYVIGRQILAHTQGESA